VYNSIISVVTNLVFVHFEQVIHILLHWELELNIN
jgi:hypothetical protein